MVESRDRLDGHTETYHDPATGGTFVSGAYYTSVVRFSGLPAGVPAARCRGPP
ncbi:hypothetical protein KOI35_27335 [Actinoplanes bogorensis]|uniref:Uncharacterized protein n=1 Tax=Paractinoplanes bogorensis TaxID=1610840 RepID=A0ABS5YUV3_9ACTN|nr:hypothetical protein [Actinoplanes bogorensis]MBU2667228.1 hypothetical protein [Actinoplanes bogorensis]